MSIQTLRSKQAPLTDTLIVIDKIVRDNNDIYTSCTIGQLIDYLRDERDKIELEIQELKEHFGI